MKILVIIPVFNEEETLRGVIAGIRSSLPQADILVVNDGSADSTGNIAREEGVLILEHPYNMGIGATMQTGFLYAFQKGYDLGIQVDGDGQHDPRYLKDLVSPILKGEADLVIGSRYLEEKGFKSSAPRRIGIRFFSILYYILTGMWVTDPTSGFRALDKKVVEFSSKEYPSDYPEAESLILFHKMGFVLKEIPVAMKERQGGTSSIHFLNSVYYMVKVTLSMVIGTLKRI
jgi:glycosyltransferase involved in cell wall biosynthesis